MHNISNTITTATFITTTIAIKLLQLLLRLQKLVMLKSIKMRRVSNIFGVAYRIKVKLLGHHKGKFEVNQRTRCAFR